MAALELVKELQPLQLEGVEETGEELGRGSYGVVFEVKVNMVCCAGKRIHDAIIGKFTVEKFYKEIKLHSQQQHQNVVKLLGIYFSPSGTSLPMLIMEYVPLSLTQYMTILPNQSKLSVLLDVANGLAYLHQKQPPVIHRDLTANNVLLTANFTAKISDLGVSRLIDKFKDETFTTAPGTPIVMPPEALNHKPVYDHKLDVFSYGCLIIHLLTGQFPVPTSQFVPKPSDPGSFIQVSEWDRRADYIIQIPADNKLIPVAKQCLTNAPAGRPDIKVVSQVVEQLLSEYPGSLVYFLSKNCIHNMIVPYITQAPDIKLNGTDVPNIRACPNCGKVVEHTTVGGKFVECPRCKTWYCFICLNLKDVCLKSSPSSGTCEIVAPKQTVI